MSSNGTPEKPFMEPGENDIIGFRYGDIRNLRNRLAEQEYTIESLVDKARLDNTYSEDYKLRAEIANLREQAEVYKGAKEVIDQLHADLAAKDVELQEARKVIDKAVRLERIR
jgi:hypothetical protein